MGKKLTNDEYINKLKKINPNIYPLEEYDYAINKIVHKCKICDNKWYVCPRDTLSGRGCPICGELKKKKFKNMSHEEYVSKVNAIHDTIKVLGLYQDNNTPINHQCFVCGHIWKTSPKSILQGNKCPKCARNYSYSQSEYIQLVKNINPYVEVIGTYKNSHTKILHKCIYCGYEWEIAPTDVLSKKGCPHCNKSKGEKSIEKVLNYYNINFEQQKKFMKCKDLLPLPFDFYLPDYNICIEFQGEQHYRSVDYFGGKDKFENLKLHDNIKQKYCQDNNIKLICISYWEFDNIENILVDELGLSLQDNKNVL